MASLNSTERSWSEPQLTISREKFGAVIFGFEGVVTQTAKLHAAAWKRLFDAIWVIARPEGATTIADSTSIATIGAMSTADLATKP